MNKEDKKLQKHLVDEMMKVSETNPDVMFYMEALMEYCLGKEKEVDKLNNIIDELEKWLEESAKYEPYVYNVILDKLKILKEGK